MKRENLQRANQIESRLKNLAESLKEIEKSPIVCICESTAIGAARLMTIGADTDCEHPDTKAAADLLARVNARLRGEIDSLLKEMEGL